MDNIIKRLIGENTTCDFKEFLERKQFKSWLKSVSAFANGLGGSLFFGVNDDAKDSREYQGNLLSLLDAGEQFYDDRLVIYSPGGMFDGTLIQERDLDDVSSKRRNPILADVFAQLDFMEKRGSGLRKIYNETAKLPGFTEAKEPRFRSQATSFYTELLNNNYRSQTNDPVNDPVKSFTLLQKDLISLLKETPTITRPELCERLNVSLATIRRAIAQLKELNIIERIGSDKAGYWKVKSGVDKLIKGR